VFAQDVPARPNEDAWPRHVLASDFRAGPPNPFARNAAAPGQALAFFPRAGGGGAKKPLLSVSGDDHRKQTLLAPTSDEPADWSYEWREIVDTKATCRRTAIGDVDGWVADARAPAGACERRARAPRARGRRGASRSRRPPAGAGPRVTLRRTP
jgi:hypothetical protein